MTGALSIPPSLKTPSRRLFAARTDLNAALKERVGAVENPEEGTIRWLQKQIEKLEKRESADKARHERIKIIQSRIAAIDTETERIGKEIAQIEGPERERIAAARRGTTQRLHRLFCEPHAMSKKPSKSFMLRSRPACPERRQPSRSSTWSFRSAGRQTSTNGWIVAAHCLIREGSIPYGTMDGLADAARGILVPAWISGDPERIRPAMSEFLTEFRKRELPPSKYMRTGVTVPDVFEWLYEVEHVKLSYSLKYNGVELEKLSPGTKGIVLLILYLGMDVADTRPLIVDQPDENLDNESIYELLTGYFKAAKRRRQIILITHNPNLVVNADSEQVVVATAERHQNGLPHITYQSGALENNTPEDRGIRQQVCRILEGGSDAFRKRERRYALREGQA